MKLRSGFRPVLINQPGADSERATFKSQLNKFTIEWDYYALLTAFVLLICFYAVYVKPIFTKVRYLIYGSDLPSGSLTTLLNFFEPILGLEDDTNLLLSVFTEGTVYFALLPF
jgi:hypothetical protein